VIADLATTSDIDAVLVELRAVRAELVELRACLPPRMVALADAAKALAVDVQTVRAMCDRDELVWRKCGRRIVVDSSSLRPAARAEISGGARAARGIR
jgi:hypothetical protein